MSDNKMLKKEEGRKTTPDKERVFSVDLESKKAVGTASVGNGRSDGVLIEGTLGMLKNASFLEGLVLEVVGTEGVLRVDLTREELLSDPCRMPVKEGIERD